MGHFITLYLVERLTCGAIETETVAAAPLAPPLDAAAVPLDEAAAAAAAALLQLQELDAGAAASQERFIVRPILVERTEK